MKPGYSTTLRQQLFPPKLLERQFSREADCRPVSSRTFAYRVPLCQSARMEQAYVLTGELRDGRSLVLDEAVPLAAGKVRVTAEGAT